MSCLINIDDMGSTRVDLPRDHRGYTLEASLWYDFLLSYGLNPPVYIDTGGG